ncbi:MAG: DnaJ domain-containing protein, partial [Oscillochloris sp.]|nr:DnaJ domain-containing protein [Oscillochloris sp.]
HYELLGISRNASADEIKHAYRQQMRRYHPDRVAAANPEERAYAGLRALRINEAYRTLSDFAARAAYNRSLSGHSGSVVRQQPAPSRPRDHQAELYDRAREHLDAGRTLQAVATLREILQLNPFYRDSAVLLEQAEALLSHRPAPPPPPPPLPVPHNSRRTLLIGAGGSLILAAIGAVAWWLRRPTAAASSASGEGTPAQSTPEVTANTVGAIVATQESPPTTAPSATPVPTERPTPPPQQHPPCWKRTGAWCMPSSSTPLPGPARQAAAGASPLATAPIRLPPSRAWAISGPTAPARPAKICRWGSMSVSLAVRPG